MLTILPVSLVIPPHPPGITYYLPDRNALSVVQLTQEVSVEDCVIAWSRANGIKLAPWGKIMLTALPSNLPLAICFLQPLLPLRSCFTLGEVEYHHRHDNQFSEAVLAILRRADPLVKSLL